MNENEKMRELARLGLPALLKRLDIEKLISEEGRTEDVRFDTFIHHLKGESFIFRDSFYFSQENTKILIDVKAIIVECKTFDEAIMIDGKI